MSRAVARFSVILTRPSWNWVATPVFVGLLCLVVYNLNFRQIGSGDTLASRFLPLGIWHYAALKLDPIARWAANGHPIPNTAQDSESAQSAARFGQWAFWITKGRDGHLYSRYPIVAPLLVTPLYAPAAAYLQYRGWQQPHVDRVAELMEKISASVIAGVASVLVFLLVRREAGRWWALVLALAFAFGTNTWMTGSQTLWQHGAAELLIALALLLAGSAPSRGRIAALGAVCVAIAANRPPDALVAGAIALWAVWTHRWNARWFFAGAALPLAALLFYNVGLLGSIAGGYGTISRAPASFVESPVWSGLAGLLVSPTRGLLVFSPFLAFAPFGFVRRVREGGTRSPALLLAMAISAELLIYSLMDWRMGIGFGPRVLSDFLPILVWLLVPLVVVLPAIGRLLFLATIALGITIQAIGAFWWAGTGEARIGTSMNAAWDWRNAPFIADLRQKRARHEFLRTTAGAIDRAGVAVPGAPPLLESGTVIEGWAVSSSGTPAQVFLIIDGIVVGAPNTFVARPEISAALHTPASTGWSTVVDLTGVQPGPRILQLAVPIALNMRVVHEQTVTVPPPPPLEAMAERAAAALRRRQNAAGYWLTTFTLDPRFESPISEMNTFLTATMIDFLSPIAPRYGLDNTVEKARAHLRDQIEPNGLVRYHGLPDAPTIGTLGFVITPDIDDTALAWRIAGPAAADPRRERMLEEIAPYRDARGLYRTWLAPFEKYQSLDPGRDPNPVDATIQMHVYQMLRDLAPVEAPGFCEALTRAIRQDDLWVYYAKAPLIPFLRSVELRRQGCDLPVQTDLLLRNPPGQDLWNEMARQLAPTIAGQEKGDDRQTAINLLERLARDDFAELRRRPPLLYHNDLTARVSRFYWSEDFGYALWLRLYDAVNANRPLSVRPSK